MTKASRRAARGGGPHGIPAAHGGQRKGDRARGARPQHTRQDEECAEHRHRHQHGDGHHLHAETSFYYDLSVKIIVLN